MVEEKQNFVDWVYRVVDAALRERQKNRGVENVRAET